MGGDITVLVGTHKSAFLLRSSDGRGTWSLEGPILEGSQVNHVVRDPADGSLLAAANSYFYGPSVRRSYDEGKTWDQGGEGLAYGSEDEEKVDFVWHIHCGRSGRLYAGVEASGLFISDDRGAHWHECAALRQHPTHDLWFSGAGGKCLHTVMEDPHVDGRLFTACSTGGVYRSDDGGETWRPMNRGIQADFLPEGAQFPEAGQCVHKVSASPAVQGRLYLQNHGGVYRSDDGGEAWSLISEGLPGDFGFPVLAHPRAGDTAFVIPHVSGLERRAPGGRLQVWRTHDAGANWTSLRQGLPERAYVSVLREAFATDGLEPAGLYFGTASGSVFASADEGETWREIASHLPRILSVEASMAP